MNLDMRVAIHARSQHPPLERDGLVTAEQGSRDRRSKELRVTAPAKPISGTE
jgi:hypothetical protein